MQQNFTAVYQKSGRWYLGYVEEVPGVNTQGKTLKEVKANLVDALTLVLEVNRALIGSTNKSAILREPITIKQ